MFKGVDELKKIEFLRYSFMGFSAGLFEVGKKAAISNVNTETNKTIAVRSNNDIPEEYADTNGCLTIYSVWPKVIFLPA